MNVKLMGAMKSLAAVTLALAAGHEVFACINEDWKPISAAQMLDDQTVEFTMADSRERVQVPLAKAMCAWETTGEEQEEHRG